MLCRWKRDAMPMEAERYPDATDKKKATLRQPFLSFSICGISVLEPLPAGLFFALATGFNLGIFDDV